MATLIVEDDRSIADVFSTVLEKAGQRAFVEHDAVAAVSNWVNDQRIDSILCDYALEGALNGVEILSAWAEVRPAVRRVLVTAHPKDDAIIDALRTGVIEVLLAKPPRLADLRAAIDLTSGRGVVR